LLSAFITRPSKKGALLRSHEVSLVTTLESNKIKWLVQIVQKRTNILLSRLIFEIMEIDFLTIKLPLVCLACMSISLENVHSNLMSLALTPTSLNRGFSNVWVCECLFWCTRWFYLWSLWLKYSSLIFKWKLFNSARTRFCLFITVLQNGLWTHVLSVKPLNWLSFGFFC